MGRQADRLPRGGPCHREHPLPQRAFGHLAVGLVSRTQPTSSTPVPLYAFSLLLRKSLPAPKQRYALLVTEQ